MAAKDADDAPLRERLAALEAVLVVVLADNERLRARVAELEAENERLTAKVADLEEERGRHSGTSSKPPSSDTLAQRAKQVEARQAAGKAKAKRRKPGKQPGDRGRNLQRVAEADRTVVHRPQCCAGCGAGLGDATLAGSSSRQVFDLPEQRVTVTDHIAERHRCACGHTTAAAFPAEATAPACWGARVRALAVYLLVRQHLPVARTAELLGDVLGAPVSAGWLAGLPGEAARRLAGFIQRLKALLRRARVIHADETGCRVSGRKWWFHTLATAALTLLICHQRRGAQALIDTAVLPGWDGVVVHDGWAPYDTLDGPDHAQCGAHLLRHLAAVAETASQAAWANHMADILRAAKAANGRAVARGDPAVPRSTAARIRARYRACLDEAFAGLPPGPRPRRRGTGGWLGYQRQAWNLAERMRRLEADILRLLDDTTIPFDNNEAERALRMVKLQQKISGCFRTPEGAHAFAAIRSYLQTAGKQHQNRYRVLIDLFTNGAWLPTATPAT